VSPSGSGLASQLSVVLLTHNCAHRLVPILRRLSALGTPVIAVDNGSADATADLLAGWAGLTTIALPVNIGAAARNTGLAAAGTPYVAFCDDDGWYDRDGLQVAVDLLGEHPRLAVVNARILVGAECRLDPISAEMAASPLIDDVGIPGSVLYGFMAGAVVMRRSAYLEVGGYEPQFFIGGEEETLAYKLARAGWHMRYVPAVIAYHQPSVANAARLRPYGMRNTLWNAWLHRRPRSALRWTMFVLWDRPKNRDYLRALLMSASGLATVVRRRSPMNATLDAKLTVLDRRRFAERRPFFTRRDVVMEDPTTWLDGAAG
jgi:GT2 family glycosyltransferase